MEVLQAQVGENERGVPGRHWQIFRGWNGHGLCPVAKCGGTGSEEQWHKRLGCCCTLLTGLPATILPPPRWATLSE